MKKLWFITLFMIPFFFACNTTEETTDEQDVVVVEEEEPSTSLTTIKVPSPVELYMFMQGAGMKFDKKLLNSIDKASKYSTKQKKALNFGIYASDLAYCTVFKQNKETFTYFSVTKKMAEELGLTEGFDEAIVKRIDKNISNSDSLYQITNDSYSSATSFLEQSGQGDLLPLLLTGAWIESVNIACRSIDKFSSENEIVLLIADQQFLLESILEIFEAIPEDERDNDMMDKLKDLQQSFDKMYDNVDVRITKNQFNEIADKVKFLRAEIVN